MMVTSITMMIIIVVMFDDHSDHHPFIVSPSVFTIYHPHRMICQQMIWEVDETLDGLIDYDEFQLTYHRNITDNTGSEPCFFFMLLNVSS